MAASYEVWIVLTWKGDLVHAASLTRGGIFSLGTGAQDWPFPETLLGATLRTLVDYREEVPRVWAKGGQWQSLMPGQRLKIEMGPFCALTTMGRIEVAGVKFHRMTFERRASLCWFGSAATILALFVAMAYSNPALTDVKPLVASESQFRFIQQFITGGDAPRDEEGPELLLGIATEELPFAEQVRGIPSRCVGYEAMGRRGAAKLDQRYAVAGPKDNPDPHLSRQVVARKHKVVLERPDRHMLGIIDTAMANDPDAPTGPWGRDTSLGTDEVSARGNMWGDAVGDAAGDDGMLKSSLDGGLLKRIEVVRSDSLTANRPARVLHSQLTVDGRLSSHDVELAIASRMSAFRGCYRADSSSVSNHEAHLELGFDVKSTGELTALRALKSENVEIPLLTCILDSAKGIAFPVETGDSKITYPLHFIPARGDTSRPVEVIALAREVPRETELPNPCGGKKPQPTKKMQPCPR